MQVERGRALGRSAKDAGPCREKATLTPVFRPVFHVDYVMLTVLRAKACLAAKLSRADAMCKKIIFTVLLAYCIVLVAFNVPTVNAQAAAAKATPVTLQGGLTLYAPAGWTAQPPAATKVVLVNAANDSLIVGSLDSGEISLAGPELTNGFPMGNGVFLRPTGTPKQAGGVYSNTFVATGTPTKALGVVMIRAVPGTV